MLLASGGTGIFEGWGVGDYEPRLCWQLGSTDGGVATTPPDETRDEREHFEDSVRKAKAKGSVRVGSITSRASLAAHREPYAERAGSPSRPPPSISTTCTSCERATISS